MGLLEYAWSIFFEKDHLKTKVLVTPKFRFPQLLQDDMGFVSIFPEPQIKENNSKEATISLMGYQFPADNLGKMRFASLFRAAVTHLGAHVVSSNFQDYEEWKKRKDRRLARFVVSVLEDIQANAYVSARHPEKLADLASANTLALKRLRKTDLLVNPTTKIMADLLIWLNTGLTPNKNKRETEAAIYIIEQLDQFRKRALLSVADKNMRLKEEKTELADTVYHAIQDQGTVTACPFLPHTEELGACSIFSPSFLVDSDMTLEKDFINCLKHLGGVPPSSESKERTHSKIAETEAIQVFDSWKRQKEKEGAAVARYEKLIPSTKFRSVEVPQQDYAGFLRARTRCKSEAHRLVESLLVASDALDEDPRKVYGVLDLQEVIQVIASKSPRMDVFMLDENLSKSYSWVILLDASKSMKYLKDFAVELFILLAEVANSLLMDPASWGMYAFNDRFLIIKDVKERYNARVKSRIGGIEFEGFTYLPDALRIAAQIIKTRAENLRLITIVSDGWPYGYPDMAAALSETQSFLEGGNIAVLGIGVKSRQMELLFKSCSTVYNLRDLTKKFSNLYLTASRTAAET